MQRLSFGFVLGYHGCDRAIGEKLLKGDPFKPSENEYDWLGPGIYFWEANPLRALHYATEAMARKRTGIAEPFASLKHSHAGSMTPMPWSEADRVGRTKAE